MKTKPVLAFKSDLGLFPSLDEAARASATAELRENLEKQKIDPDDLLFALLESYDLRKITLRFLQTYPELRALGDIR